jgi:hypothetical protein
VSSFLVYNPTLSIGFLYLCSAIACCKTVALALRLSSYTSLPCLIASLVIVLALAFMLTSSYTSV